MCVWSATKLGWSKVSRWFGAPTYCMCVPDSDSLPLSSATTSPRYSSALHSRKSSPFGVGRHLRRFSLGQHRNPRANREALMLPETSRAPRNPHHPADNFTGNGPLSNAYTAKRGTDHRRSLCGVTRRGTKRQLRQRRALPEFRLPRSELSCLPKSHKT